MNSRLETYPCCAKSSFRSSVVVCRSTRVSFAILLAAAYANADVLSAEQKVYDLVKAKRRPSDTRWLTMQTRTLAGMPQAAAVKPPLTSRFGGWAGEKWKATGHFRTQRDADGRWWLVDPDGFRFITVGLNAVRPNSTTKGHKAMRTKWGSKTTWARHTSGFLKTNGFNTLGCWSYWLSMKHADGHMPYTTQLNFMARYGKKRGGAEQGKGHRSFPNECIFVFDPEFPKFCESITENLGTPSVRNDAWLLGRFSDNELPFPADALDRYLSLEEGDHGRREAERWLRALKGKDVSKDTITDGDRAAFLGHVAETYFRICSTAIEKYDPNHLYLGCRFHGRVLRSEPVFRACAKYVDVVSVNWYGRWSAHRGWMNNWLTWTGRPFLISEWYAKGADSGMPNNSGAGWLVKTQADRGKFYHHFALGLVEHPGCVGWHWFRYMDNDPKDVLIDPTNTDSNKGIVNCGFEPYEPLVDAMRQLNTRIYPLRVHLREAQPPAEPKVESGRP